VPAQDISLPSFSAARRILLRSDDGTLRLWDAAWRDGNLFEIA
jgi:hypothetical protein